MNTNNEYHVFSGHSNPELAQEVCKYLSKDPAPVDVSHFSDGEIHVRSKINVRGKEVFVIQSTNQPSDNLMELLIIIDSLKRASAEKITAIIPYFGYARQDRKTQAREPITAKLVSNLISTAGANRVISIDLHAGQIQGFFDIPSDNLTAVLLFSKFIRNKKAENIVIVSPDVGGVNRVKQLSVLVGSNFAICSKNREESDRVESINLIGNVRNKTAILLDDIISTASTLTLAANELKKQGAAKVLAFATHGIFVENAMEKITQSPIDEVYITNTIRIDKKKLDACPKLKILSIAPLIGEAIERVYHKRSLSELFDDCKRTSLFNQIEEAPRY